MPVCDKFLTLPDGADAEHHRPERSMLARSIAGMTGLFACLVLLLIGMKFLFLCSNWSVLNASSAGSLAKSLLYGLRFDVTTAAALLWPAITAWCLLLLINRRFLRWFICLYLPAVAFIVPVIAVSDLEYFQESGKHVTYEFLAYMGSGWMPAVLGAFTLQPWFLSISLAASIGFTLAVAFAIRRLMKACTPDNEARVHAWPPNVPILSILIVVTTLGGLGMFYLEIGDSVVWPDPYLNALSLNPVYAVLRTAFSPEKPYLYETEEQDIRTTRDLLGCGEQPPLDPRYPLLRESLGSPEPNGRNVVLVILESWSGTDIGCLGSEVKVTPAFDALAAQGMLFTKAYATGVRTSEGVFSILCSYPNQPVQPIMKRSSFLQNHWRSLSQILADVGYHNLFIHGRDLDFDHMRNLLQAIHFHRIIDRRDFGSSLSQTDGGWAGFHDEDVMRRADAEFAAQGDHPFFGVIYTMNTHPPFITPDGFPKVRESDTDADRYLNALHYADHTIQVLLDLARAKPYFKNTIFIFVADHARTRSRFNISTQHHIPLLFYAPEHVPARINPVVASQVDILPTVLGLLNLKTRHASWGRDLMTLSEDQGFALCIVGDEARWFDRRHLLSDGLTDEDLLLFDLQGNPACTRNIWDQEPGTGEDLKHKLRSYLSLSQRLLYENRVYP